MRLKMESRISDIFRIVILALSVQVLCPCFVTVVNDSPLSPGETVIQDKHHAINSILLFNEKEEESEERNENLAVHLVQLIDFTEHSSTLKNSHEIRITPSDFRLHIDHQPPLFTLHSVFLI